MTMNCKSILPFVFGVALIGCAGASHDDEVSANDEAVTSGGPSGYAECPGLGWTNSIQDWKGVAGSYMRLGVTPPGEFSQLTVFEDPSESNRGLVPYLRTWKFLPDSGKVVFGVDNPAIGPAIEFLDDSLTPK